MSAEFPTCQRYRRSAPSDRGEAERARTRVLRTLIALVVLVVILAIAVFVRAILVDTIEPRLAASALVAIATFDAASRI